MVDLDLPYLTPYSFLHCRHQAYELLARLLSHPPAIYTFYSLKNLARILNLENFRLLLRQLRSRLESTSKPLSQPSNTHYSDTLSTMISRSSLSYKYKLIQTFNI